MIDATTNPLAINFAGIDLQNPLNTASGTYGYARQFEEFYDVGATLGAVTCKGCAPEAWLGNPAPRLAERTSSMLNSVGLQNPGVRVFAAEYGLYLQELEARGCRVIVQAVGHSVDEYVCAVELYEELLGFVSAIELNVSCPNVDRGGAALGSSTDGVLELLEAVRPRTKKPLMVKIGPYKVGEIARAAEDGGADAVSLINTIPAMAIDTTSYKSQLCRSTAGLSGPAIHPIAVAAVYEAHQTCKLPLCAMGGVSTGNDVAEMILAGATLVSLGTVNLYDPMAAPRILAEFTRWYEQQNVSSLSELIGAFKDA